MRNCTTKEQSERLHDAGLPYSEADVNMQEESGERIAPTYPAWTFTRLWELLPNEIEGENYFSYRKQMMYDFHTEENVICYCYSDMKESEFRSKEIVDAAVEMMIWWLSNKPSYTDNPQ